MPKEGQTYKIAGHALKVLRKESGRIGFEFDGKPMRASEICRALGMEVGADSAVRVILRHLQASRLANRKEVANL